MNNVFNYSIREKTLPAPTMFFRLIRLFPWIIKLPLFNLLKRPMLPNIKSSTISPGFYAIVPDYLHADSSNLNDTIFINYAPINIGYGTRFSGENLLLTSTHDEKDFDKVIAKPINIGKNVWITYRCIVMGGVTIGDNSIIGAGSIVTSDIPSGVIAAGNPCRVIREIRK